ncbi:MAG: Rha family transcriptional regulator [Bacteroides sp.]|nr:Rha family transcriptional regulator [Bacteroides sp.]
MNLPIHQPTMTSLQIAEVGGKRHKDVMRSIRKMEEAWYKVNGRKFALVDYIDEKGEKRPCYNLTKEECLYIATKFNDEARARLVLRWLELESIQRPETMADIFAESERLADEMREDLASGKILPAMDVVLTSYDIAIYSYLRNGIKSSIDTPFCVTKSMISRILGIDVDDVQSAWERLERGGYIVTRKFGDKCAFILGSRIP